MFEDNDTLEIDGSFDPPEVVQAFLEAWVAGDYENAYKQLASNSPLREDLSQAEWAKKRAAWAKQAKPKSIKFDINFEYDYEPEEDEEEDVERPDVVEVFWSLEKTDTALDSTLEELPRATLTYPETGRQWFWTKYTLIEDGEDFRILDIDDEGTAAQQLSQEELQRHIEEQVQEVESMMEDIGMDSIDPSNIETLDDEETLGMALGMSDPTELLQQLTWLTERGMHYSDALIAKTPDDMELYDRAAAQAALLQDWERAAAYVTLILDRFKEERGETLSNLAIIVSNLVTDYDAQGMLERSEHFARRVEQLLREAIESYHNFTAHILLANLLIDEGSRLDDAEKLLKDAQSFAEDQAQQAQVEAGLGNLAETRGDGRTALRHYQKAAQLHPELPDVWSHIGDIQSKLGNLSEAEKSYLQAVQVNPEEAYPYVELATIYTASNQFDKAHAILDQGMEHSEAADLLAAHALSYIYANDLRSAEEYLLEAEDVDKENELVQNVRHLYDSRRAAQKRASKPNKANKAQKPGPGASSHKPNKKRR